MQLDGDLLTSHRKGGVVTRAGRRKGGVGGLRETPAARQVIGEAVSLFPAHRSLIIFCQEHEFEDFDWNQNNDAYCHGHPRLCIIPYHVTKLSVCIY